MENKYKIIKGKGDLVDQETAQAVAFVKGYANTLKIDVSLLADYTKEWAEKATALYLSSRVDAEDGDKKIILVFPDNTVGVVQQDKVVATDIMSLWKFCDYNNGHTAAAEL